MHYCHDLVLYLCDTIFRSVCVLVIVSALFDSFITQISVWAKKAINETEGIVISVFLSKW